MKLSHVMISNLASFPYIADLHEEQGVSFWHKKDDINIFIGPNGSGKSIFLDIIQQVCNVVLFLPYTFNVDRFRVLSQTDSQEVIQYVPTHLHNIRANFTGVGKPSFVHVTFALNEQDRANMKFVLENQEAINNLIAKYSTATVRFNYHNIIQYLSAYEYITCKVQVDTNTNSIRLLDQNAEDIEKYMYDFFTHFYLIQHCIAIHNILEPENHWHSLHATMAIVGSYRNLTYYSDTYTIGSDRYDRLAQNVSDVTLSSVKTTQDHLIGLLYVKKKIARYLYEKNPHATVVEIEELLKTNDLFQKLQQFCRKYIRRSLTVKMALDGTNTYLFGLVDEQGNEYFLDDLSAGEKSILGIICTVYGFGLYEGLLVIDEPELHLHPQLQKKFLALIEEVVKEFSLQCILTTHSAMMINENNIKHVYRFYNNNGKTLITTPGDRYNEDTGKLMQILRVTNTAKIFFVKKIIMVEGETDEYAFTYYLNHLAKTDPQWEVLLQNYEIVNINGKGGYARWKRFLRTFGLESYFIGDWDNIQDAGGAPLNMQRYARLALRNSRTYVSKSDKYKAIITYLRRYEPKHRDEIADMIHSLYAKNIFILQRGDIEAYLGMQEKGLEETVQFFHNDFHEWLENPKFDENRKELNRIFKRIFTDGEESN